MSYTMTEVASVTNRLNDQFNREVVVSRTQGDLRDTFNLHLYNVSPGDEQAALKAVETAVGRKPQKGEVTFSKGLLQPPG